MAAMAAPGSPPQPSTALLQEPERINRKYSITFAQDFCSVCAIQILPNSGIFGEIHTFCIILHLCLFMQAPELGPQYTHKKAGCVHRLVPLDFQCQRGGDTCIPGACQPSSSLEPSSGAPQAPMRDADLKTQGEQLLRKDTHVHTHQHTNKQSRVCVHTQRQISEN